jgi:hypothetical protein
LCGGRQKKKHSNEKRWRDSGPASLHAVCPLFSSTHVSLFTEITDKKESAMDANISPSGFLHDGNYAICRSSAANPA